MKVSTLRNEMKKDVQFLKGLVAEAEARDFVVD